MQNPVFYCARALISALNRLKRSVRRLRRLVRQESRGTHGAVSNKLTKPRFFYCGRALISALNRLKRSVRRLRRLVIQESRGTHGAVSNKLTEPRFLYCARALISDLNRLKRSTGRLAPSQKRGRSAFRHPCQLIHIDISTFYPLKVLTLKLCTVIKYCIDCSLVCDDFFCLLC